MTVWGKPSGVAGAHPRDDRSLNQDAGAGWTKARLCKRRLRMRIARFGARLVNRTDRGSGLEFGGRGYTKGNEVFAMNGVSGNRYE
jgi:hypothetical protein